MNWQLFRLGEARIAAGGLPAAVREEVLTP